MLPRCFTFSYLYLLLLVSEVGFILILLWNIPLYCVNIHHRDWVNKEADWPIARQAKVRRENQTKDIEKKKGGVESHDKPWRKTVSSHGKV